jgi:hypothetical protein
MRILLAAMLIGHGAAHVGFAVPWNCASCILPESRPGLVANIVVLALLIAGGVWGWLDRPQERNSCAVRMGSTLDVSSPRS